MDLKVMFQLEDNEVAALEAAAIAQGHASAEALVLTMVKQRASFAARAPLRDQIQTLTAEVADLKSKVGKLGVPDPQGNLDLSLAPNPHAPTN